MLKFVKKYHWPLFLAGIVIAFYFVVRLPNLTAQPIFADEAIYIRWSQVMKAEATLRFLPLTDGKTPLYMWAMIPLFKFFSDPLFAGRLLSVVSGFFTMLGIFLLGWRFFNLRVGLWGALLISVTPFIVFFDRMALVDSMLSAFSVWSLFLALLLVHFPKTDLAMVLGYSLAGGMMTKTPGFVSILTIPAGLILLTKHDRNDKFRILKILVLWILAVGIALGIYNFILRLGPGFSNLSSRDQDYIFSPLDLVGRPLDPFIPHLKDMFDWFPKLLTWPLCALLLGGIGWTLFKRNRAGLAVLAWLIVPLIAEMVFLKTFTARYILFSIPPMLLLTAWFIDILVARIPLRAILAVVLMLVILLPQALFFDYKLITDINGAPLPSEERRGYLEDWTAGYHLKDIANYLINESKNSLVVVGTEGYFGTLPDGLEIYLDKHSHQVPAGNQVIVIGGKSDISDQLRRSALTNPTYFIANRQAVLKYIAGTILLKEYLKPDIILPYRQAIYLYRVLPATPSSAQVAPGDK